MNSFSWITRSSLDWVSGGMFPISSKKIVPPWATSNRPFLCDTAPVKAPLTWPNRVLSRSSLGIDPEFTVTNGPSLRFELLWIDLATSSLPVPLSPRIRMLLLDGAARRIRSKTWRIGRLLPMMLSKPWRSRSCSLRSRFSAVRRRRSRPWRMVSRTSSFLNGLGR